MYINDRKSEAEFKNTKDRVVITKTYKDSYFTKLNMDSVVTSKLFDIIPTYKGERVVVIQFLVLEDNNIIFELIEKNKFDSMF